ncbi:DNA cytosine methyltransferase [Mucilaginibacter sp.]|jgi:DNA (cytosine-5)-methyltransferase 3A|uniref:DNA cytosine methyltransferase n=1 Tax=Mucilaginibacter sp. TaxID=1882438 RepID=UPI00356369AB
MNVLSLFDGKSCGRLCLQQAGIKVKNYYASEIDPYAIKISKQKWPDIKHIGDVQSIDIDNSWYLGHTNISYDKGVIMLNGDIDLLMAGSPCQGFSNAGLGMNFEDPRSKLFWTFIHLLRQLQRGNPKVLFWLENVKMKKEWRDIISKELGVEPIELNHGICSPTERKRLYWTNIQGVKLPSNSHIIINDILEHEVSYKYLITQKALERGQRKTYSKMRFNPSKCGTLNTKNNSGQMSIDSGTTLIQVGVADGIKGHESKTRVYDPKGKCPTLLTHQGGHHHAKIAVDEELWRRLTPLECERIHGLPDNYTEGVSDSQRYRMIGNGWECRGVTEMLKAINL